MELQGCLRLHNEYHVRVLINAADWGHRVTLRPGEEGSFPELCMPLDYTLAALDHENLIKAARAQLHGPNQWWVVDVFVETPAGGSNGNPAGADAQTLQARLVRSLQEHYPNVRQPQDGLIYQKIRQYGGHLRLPRDVQAEKDWWAVLHSVPKTKKPRYLSAFLRHGSFPQAFDALLPIPGLWKDMHIGSLHTLIYMRCDEPILCCLERIRQIYYTIFDNDTDLLSHVDAHSVQLLQSRVPKVSNRDLEFLEKKMEERVLFPSIHDDGIRDAIWGRLQTVDVPIPTLYTFFRDRRYLDVAKDVMCCLFIRDPDHKVTIDQGIIESVQGCESSGATAFSGDSKWYRAISDGFRESG
ncbi:hypothetical protein BBP40_004297 [Aspergillus hancockii]|nr:hypothetical protein BBP40_004297 [Aspergillus hancockii]